MNRTVIILTLLFFLAGCGSSDKRSEIGEIIYSAVSAAEERDVEKFMKIISIEYLDDEERTKADIREKVKTYLNRFRGISVNILNIKTVNKSMTSAEVITEISFSSGIGKMFSKMVRSYGETYRFNLKMVEKIEKWEVIDARWEWMSLEDLYPESLKVLRELFPNTF